MISGVGTTTTSSYLLELQQTTQSQSITALAAGTSTTSSGSVSTVGSSGDTASISGPGKLFAELQQLQTSDPAKFKEVTADIASKLQTASQQATGQQSDFLSDLASKFQTASTTGDASGLQPKHHGHHAHGTYNAQGQTASTSGAGTPPPPPVSDSSSTGGVDLKQLFASISQEVAQAVSA